MASIYKPRRTANNHESAKPRWRVGYTDAVGRRVTKTFRSEAEAKEFRTMVDHDTLTSSLLNHELSRATVHDFAKPWFDSLAVKPSTKDGYRCSYNTWVLPHFGNSPVGQLTRHEIRSWAMSITEVHGRAGSTRDQAVNALRSVLNFAVEMNAIKSNPVTGMKLPKLPSVHEMRFLTVPEIRQLALTCATYPYVKGKGRRGMTPTPADNPINQLIIEFACFTGVRAGELWALRWCDIDLDGAAVIVRRSAAELDNGSLVIGLTKNSKVRRVPLPSWMVDQLRHHKFLAVGKDNEYVFPDSNGGLKRHSNFVNTVFRPACKEVGKAGLRFHDLRHTYVSLLIANGADPKIIQTRVGHASVMITFDIYGHVLPEKDDLVTEALGALYLDAVQDELSAGNVVSLRA